MKLKRIVIVVVAIGAFVLCSCKRQSQMLNEDLRLSDEEIRVYTQRASSGDAEAAKRLWHHYDFVVHNIQEGERWRKIYEDLKQRNAASKNSPTNLPKQ